MAGHATDLEAALAESESRLRAIFHASPAWISVTRLADGRITDVNEAFTRMSGWSREEAIGRTTAELGIWADPADRDKVVEIVRRTGRLEGFETELRSRNGGRVRLMMSAEVLDFAGEPSLVSFSFDITQVREAQAAAERAFAVLEQVVTSVVITDPEGRIQYVNDAAVKSTGYSRDELVGAPIRVLAPDEREAEEMLSRMQKLARGESWRGRLRNRRKDGSVLWEQATMTPMVNERGRVTHFVAVKEDVTDAVRLEVERRDIEQRRIDARRLESLGTLAGGVAHDFNNVLAAILSLASLHKADAPDGSPLRQSLETIEQACLRGRAVVRDLLGIARQAPGALEVVNLNSIIREEVALLAKSRLAHLRVRVDLDSELDGVLGEAASLHHVVMNLCANAADAMPEGGTLVLRTSNAADRTVLVEVIDDGCGMTEEVRAHALDPFFTTKEFGKGTGLGLTMIYAAVNVHRGEMKIDSQVGRGTAIRITLPSLPRAAPAVAGGPKPDAARELEGTQGPLRVLVVDDDPLVQRSTRRALVALGHQAQLASGGAEALALLESGEAFDVVFLDLSMPGIGGAEVLPRIRALRPDLPVFLVTGRPDQSAIDLSTSTPGVRLLGKPFTVQELGTLLGQVF